jgi:glycosyltransferase involved in cell wall biosynthesis
MNPKKREVDLISVIVPAYKQERTIQQDLKRIQSTLGQTDYNYEIICVTDGQVDHTYQKAKQLESDKLKVIGYKNNKGKGHAVRFGMKQANGDLVAFLDAGMEIEPAGLNLLLDHMFWYDSDIIVGSIRHSASKVKGYPLKRKILSWGYHTLTKILFGLNITDCQRGIKVFKRQVLDDTLDRLLVKQYAFDIEMLAVAKRMGYENIHDGPVEMDANKMNYSSVKASTVFNMFKDTLAVFYRLNILHYYEKQA